MVEPTTLTAAAIATMIATKAFEKTGEKIGEAVGGLIPKFLGALRRKDPKTADAITTVAQQPELAEQQPEIYSTPALVAKVETIAQDDAEVQRGRAGNSNRCTGTTRGDRKFAAVGRKDWGSELGHDRQSNQQSFVLAIPTILQSHKAYGTNHDRYS